MEKPHAKGFIEECKEALHLEKLGILGKDSNGLFFFKEEIVKHPEWKKWIKKMQEKQI